MRAQEDKSALLAAGHVSPSVLPTESLSVVQQGGAGPSKPHAQQPHAQQPHAGSSFSDQLGEQVAKLSLGASARAPVVQQPVHLRWPSPPTERETGSRGGMEGGAAMSVCVLACSPLASPVKS